MLILGNEVSIVMKTPAHQNQLAIKAVITITCRDKEEKIISNSVSAGFL